MTLFSFRYKEGKQTEAANDHMIADKIDGVTWESLKANKEYIKFPVRIQKLSNNNNKLLLL